MIATGIIGITMMANVMAASLPAEPTYQDLGEMRITTYCEVCNDPGGRSTSTGEEARPGTCAGPAWLVGSTIYVDGEELYVNDVCGCDNTIDIWVEGDCGENVLEYRDVVLEVKNE